MSKDTLTLIVGDQHDPVEIRHESTGVFVKFYRGTDDGFERALDRLKKRLAERASLLLRSKETP